MSGGSRSMRASLTRMGLLCVDELCGRSQKGRKCTFAECAVRCRLTLYAFIFTLFAGVAYTVGDINNDQGAWTSASHAR